MPPSNNNTVFEGIVAQRLTTIIGLLSGSGTIPVTGPFLTNDELRASPVPIYNKDVVAQTIVSDSSQEAILTLPAIGQYYNITFIEITKYSVDNLSGIDTPITVTTENLYDLAFLFSTKINVGEVERLIYPITSPLRCQDTGANTVIHCPQTDKVLWRITVHYYLSN